MANKHETLTSLQAQFKRQAVATPNAIAVVDEIGISHSYGELDRETDLLAAHLRQLGVKENKNVGIFMSRTYEYALSYIAILKAGGGYLVMDVAYPQHQILEIAEEAAPVVILTNDDSRTRLSEGLAERAINLGRGWREWLEDLHLSVDGIPVDSHMEDLAFIAYSSGTTGKPKGIQNPQRCPVISYHARETMFPYGENEKEACNIFFIWEMLRPLTSGHTLHIIPDDTIYDPHRLLRFLKERAITRMLFTPSLLETVLESTADDVSEHMKSMRNIWLNGEVVTTSLLRRCVELIPHVHILNLYSISETHEVAACDLTECYNRGKEELMSRKFCPVGKILPHVKVCIMTENLQLSPVGVPGEIYIGGPTLAIGYLNRPEVNKVRFITAPDGQQLYRTGDWGYLLGGGSLEICGRCDSMVKIRGYSVEVQAIEKTMMQLDVVNSCVVVVRGEEGEDKFLVAYIVPQGQPTKKEIRAELKQRLPFFMIPSFFVFLSEIPLIPASGKLDKKALPPLHKEEASVEAEFLPKTKTELALSDIWKTVLELHEIDIQESFFDLGGHSLLATKLLTHINNKFGVQLAVKDLFQYSTVSQMARLIDNQAVDTVMTKLDLHEEVKKMDQAKSLDSMDIQLRAFWRHIRWNEHRWNHCCVLLTGATGYVGCYILRDLLMKTKNHVFCLIREGRSGDEENRILSALRRHGILTSDDQEEDVKLIQAVKERVTVIHGDIGLIQMGQSDDDYNYLSTEIDLIIHAAAYVNLIYPYHALKQSNVMGTNNILLFAAHSKVKPVHYISTDAVFPHGIQGAKEDDDMSHFADRLTDGYSQTKWVAEQLVIRAKERGHPVVIYRLGNMSGDSITGNWNASDFNLLLLRGIITTGWAPEVDWAIEMTPVDFASQLIVKMVLNLSLVVGSIYHVINTNPKPFRQMLLSLKARGYEIQMTDYAGWKNKVADCKNFNDGSHLLQLLDGMNANEQFFRELSTYKNENLEKIMKRNFSMKYPQIDDSLLVIYFTSLAGKKLIPQPTHNQTMSSLPLRGRVAVVTGASSGIGQTVAMRLAEAGCDVALVARREEKLRQLVLSIAALKAAGRAFAAPADVTSRPSVKAAVTSVESELGEIDILVNCAGVMHYTLLRNVHEEEWEQAVDVNCKGVLNTVGAVLPGMVRRKRGHIVNLSSDAGFRPFPGLAVYSGTKYFVEGFSQAMRLELVEDGVKVTCVQPGDVNTPMQDMSSDKEAVEKYANADRSKMLDTNDIARAVVYAVSQPDGVAVNSILVEPRACPV